MVRRAVVLLACAAVGVLAFAAPAAAKAPPFDVRVTPHDVLIGEPVTVDVLVDEDSSWNVEVNGFTGVEYALTVRSVVRSSVHPTVVGDTVLARLSPQRSSTHTWRATFVPRRAGEIAVVSFGNVHLGNTAYSLPPPVVVTVHAERPATREPVVLASRTAPLPPDGGGSFRWWWAAAGVAALSAVVVGVRATRGARS
jgi:hypothetical protein